MGRLTESDVFDLRDPFVLAEDGVYYMYGTGWVMYKNGSGDLRGPWEGPFPVVEDPADCDGCRWAPEVHRYRGAYYMFTTYRSAKNGKKGCAVFRSERPEGPFRLHSDGHFTPGERESIDATLYVDRNGDPWTVYVDEWVATDDGVGRMAAARMADDLSRTVSEPIELFRADAPGWAFDGSYVTDGPFLFDRADGSLSMIWSNFDRYGYCITVSRSPSGFVAGPWVHDPVPFYTKGETGRYDGGHGMVFRGTDGKDYLSFHSPNSGTEERGCKPVFLSLDLSAEL
ncbi:MAG: family 43 glycosylhydrolase [Clostridia bacterium]|nr:family 43 glycosylhydrolase [Clostridia bacterium]